MKRWVYPYWMVQQAQYKHTCWELFILLSLSSGSTKSDAVVSQVLHMRADQDKAAGQTVSETWRRGVDGAPAGVLLLDHLLGLLQLCRVSVVSSPQILHMTHHEFDCPAHSGLLSKTVELHVEPHWLNDITNDECILDYFGLPGTHIKWS